MAILTQTPPSSQPTSLLRSRADAPSAAIVLEIALEIAPEIALEIALEIVREIVREIALERLSAIDPYPPRATDCCR